jgi:hypothetical protein
MTKPNRQQLTVLSLDEVGAMLGLSRQRVQIIESEALRKLRARLSDVLQQEFGDLGDNPHTAAFTRARLAREYQARKKARTSATQPERAGPCGPEAGF